MNVKSRQILKFTASFLILTFGLNALSYAALDLKPSEIPFFQKSIANIQFPKSVATVEEVYDSSLRTSSSVIARHLRGIVRFDNSIRAEAIPSSERCNFNT